MNRLLKTKKGYIALLQKYNGWGRDDEDTKSLLDVFEVLDPRSPQTPIWGG
jgi:hypothetical protein